MKTLCIREVSRSAMLIIVVSSRDIIILLYVDDMWVACSKMGEIKLEDATAKNISHEDLGSSQKDPWNANHMR